MINSIVCPEIINGPMSGSRENRDPEGVLVAALLGLYIKS